MTAQNLVNTPDNRLVVAVDGPSGVGKSTLCRAVAKHFGAQYFDTGAMYRAATLAVLRAGVNPAERAAVIAATNNLNITLDDQTVLLDGEDVSEEIRSQEVTRMVSAVSAIPEVRATLIGPAAGVGEYHPQVHFRRAGHGHECAAGCAAESIPHRLPQGAGATPV